MKYALYLGCQIPFLRPDLEVAIREVSLALGIELVDLEGYSCCPTWISVPSYDIEAWLALSARNIALAEEKNLDMVVGCNNCYSVLNHARYMLKDEKWREKTNRILSKVGRVYRGSSKVLHIIHILESVEKKIKKSLKYDLKGLTVAVQPGCHTLWPERVMDIREENPFYPKKLRELVEILGASAPHYSRMEFCCGMGSMKTIDYERSLEFVLEKLKSMKEEIDPDMIVTACSSCYIQLDEAQQKLERDGKIDFKIPVFYYPQILAVCMGFDVSKVARFSSIPKDEIIRRIVG
ncbi:CoB--CoM heterodisulfide reductase iron-sulfur subunit B family protein [Archaeoglobus neptunius]|uniref:CoB--CoM heterodisulfide reductase iron-sulfur subunit B family protein n=1 Tax=Archaeoglobus neptunius TaxID=2798580 RepID=UPI001925BEFD|nr:CoB--CoM heterodisulfide reductase iron-sulfur subunit B family protein [Archaeoglobus neptunius]